MYIPHFSRPRQFLRILLLGGVCVAASFIIGIQSAGEVHPVSLIEAGAPSRTGDVNGDGVVDTRDAVFILEVVQGYRVAAPEQLLADPDGDGTLTVNDAIRVLNTLP
jgi:hypothetical protein